MKVVSLLPAATEIVCSLGLRADLVARSHECDFPAGVEALPALTRARVDSSLPSAELDEQVRKVVASRLPVYTLDEAMLAALAPDVVVTQEACEVCAISYDQVVAAVHSTSARAQVIALSPTRLDHIIEDVRRVAGACGVSERGFTVAEDLRRRLKQATTRTTGRPRVAVIEWLAPVMLAGHWVPDAIQAAGGIAVGPEPGRPSPYAAWDEVRALAPDAVIVAPCGFDLDRTRREGAPFADRLRALAPRVLLLDGNSYLNRPGRGSWKRWRPSRVAPWRPCPGEPRSRAGLCIFDIDRRPRPRFRGTNSAGNSSIHWRAEPVRALFPSS